MTDLCITIFCAVFGSVVCVCVTTIRIATEVLEQRRRETKTGEFEK